jgi:dihydroorotate dehydrogenase
VNPFYKTLYPVIKLMDPERAHVLSIKALKVGLAGLAFNDRQGDRSILRTQAFGLDFSNPVGLAAGYDKHAEAPDAILRLGFGFTEAGTVTPRAQAGNPKPRLFRLTEDRAVINRFGFNSEGLVPFKRRLEERQNRERTSGIFGANLGANKESEDRAGDYVTGLQALKGLADYFTINISSPNTPGLRGLQDKAELVDLIDRIKSAGATAPLLLKIAPDVTDAELEDICQVVVEKQMDGLIISNTTLLRPKSLRSHHAGETGGLSGAPLFKLSTERLGRAYKLTGGKIPLVGVGGISTGRQAFEKILAGASLVQLYSAMVFDGPALVQKVKSELELCLRADGFDRVGDAVGQSVK